MFSSILTGGLNGMEAYLLQAEVDISHGLPTFCMVGSLSNEVRDITIAKMIQIRARKVAETRRFLPNIRGIPRFKVLISPHRASF